MSFGLFQCCCKTYVLVLTSLRVHGAEVKEFKGRHSGFGAFSGTNTVTAIDKLEAHCSKRKLYRTIRSINTGTNHPFPSLQSYKVHGRV